MLAIIQSANSLSVGLRTHKQTPQTCRNKLPLEPLEQLWLQCAALRTVHHLFNLSGPWLSIVLPLQWPEELSSAQLCFALLAVFRADDGAHLEHVEKKLGC